MLSTKIRQKQGFRKNNFYKDIYKLTRNLENIRSNEIKQCFQNKTVQLATRQPKTYENL